MKREVCLVFLRRGNELLLAMKKRGFGAGNWNGTGGKIEPGETPLQAAVRETQEEIGVTPRNLQLVGRLRFFLHDQPDFEHYCHVFVATDWDGEPSESEEMRPQWFEISAIPYHHMWADDPIWLPLLLDGKLFQGSVTVDGDRIIKQDIKTVTALTEESL